MHPAYKRSAIGRCVILAAFGVTAVSQLNISVLASPEFVDFDGDGVSESVEIRENGNAGNTYFVYSSGKKSQPLAKLESVRSTAEFKDVDHDGRCEAIARDSVFFGWKTSNADSAMPLVILRLHKKKFELATELMRKPPPSKEFQDKMLANWSNACTETYDRLAKDKLVEKFDKQTFYFAPEVWRDLLDLIYSGNSTLAFHLLDRFWQNKTYAGNLENRSDCAVGHTTKEQFVGMFLKQLRHSEYIEGIRQLNERSHHDLSN